MKDWSLNGRALPSCRISETLICTTVLCRPKSCKIVGAIHDTPIQTNNNNGEPVLFVSSAVDTEMTDFKDWQLHRQVAFQQTTTNHVMPCKRSTRDRLKAARLSTGDNHAKLASPVGHADKQNVVEGIHAINLGQQLIDHRIMHTRSRSARCPSACRWRQSRRR